MVGETLRQRPIARVTLKQGSIHTGALIGYSLPILVGASPPLPLPVRTEGCNNDRSPLATSRGDCRGDRTEPYSPSLLKL